MAAPKVNEPTAFSRYKEEHGSERTAETLSALLGKPVSVKYVQSFGRFRQVPPAWREALGLEGSPLGAEPEPVSEGGETQPGDGRQAETPPKPPAGAKILQLPLPQGDFAKKRISSAYQLVGAGIAEGVGNPGVGKVWDDHSDPIAQAWLDAAETSDFARKFVQFMTAGGPMGEVVMLHVTMLAGTLYVIGQFPEVGFFGKYSTYRPKRPTPSGEGDSEPEPGAAGKGAVRPLAAS